jgi:hypothetical protein
MIPQWREGERERGRKNEIEAQYSDVNRRH